MKKRLLFCMYGLGIGGIEKCLVNLVNSLDSKLYDITIAVMNPEYEFLNAFRSDVNFIMFEEQFINTTETMSLISKMPWSINKAKKFFTYLIYRVAVKLRIMPWMVQKSIDQNYDIAIAYSHTGYVPEYVISKVNANKKILWYHTLWIDKKRQKIYSRFDEIVAVSEFCKKNFCDNFPALKEKVSVLYNLYDLESIKKLSLEPQNDLDSNKFAVVTVARLSEEKGYELAISACAQIKQLTNSSFCWYWVGSGPDCEKARKLIEKFGVQNEFILLGNRSNPYPYIKACDVYAQTSLSEAYCTTIIEAKTLSRAIVATEIGSVYEQIEDSINAYICQKDANDIAKKIALLLHDKQTREEFEKNSGQKNESHIHLEQYNKLFLK